MDQVPHDFSFSQCQSIEVHSEMTPEWRVLLPLDTPAIAEVPSW